MSSLGLGESEEKEKETEDEFMSITLNDWCDEHLPQLYTPCMFENEEVEENVWCAVDDLLEMEVLPFVENPSDVYDTVCDAAQIWFEELHDALADDESMAESEESCRSDSPEPDTEPDTEPDMDPDMDPDEMEAINDWCDEHLPLLYNTSMFDYEDVADDVWCAIDDLLETEVLPFMKNPSDIQAAVSDAAQTWFTEHHDALLESLESPVAPERITALLERPQIEQHTPEWYAERGSCLTASEIKALFCGSRGTLLRSKVAAIRHSQCAGPTPTPHATVQSSHTPVAISMDNGEMVATVWGHRFEPVVRDIYELEIAGVDTVCDTLGRLTHATVPWLKASPDGLVVRGSLAGRVVEIKAPKTRVPGAFVPDDYWFQMQVQMEVMDMDAVDFLEAQFKQRRASSLADVSDSDSDLDRADCLAANWKGRIRVYGFIHDSSTWVYRYSRPVEDIEDASFDAVVPLPSMPLLEDTVWWLAGWFPRTVLRDRPWWAEIGWPAAEQFWADVQAAVLASGSGPDSGPHATTLVVERVQWMGRASAVEVTVETST